MVPLRIIATSSLLATSTQVPRDVASLMRSATSKDNEFHDVTVDGMGEIEEREEFVVGTGTEGAIAQREIKHVIEVVGNKSTSPDVCTSINDVPKDVFPKKGNRLNKCKFNHCAYSSGDGDVQCFSCESLDETRCQNADIKGCIYTTLGCRFKLYMSLGGSSHSDNGQWSKRPEEVHSEICQSGKCQGCSTSSKCWHGAGSGQLEVKVPPGTDSTQTVRSAHALLGCGDNSGEFWIKVHKLINSQLAVFVDGKNQNMPSTTGRFDLDVPKDGGDHIVVIKHTVLQKASESVARIRFKAEMQPWVDQCLSRKVCLDVFGDGSEAGFKTRNSNRLQLDCLDGRPTAEDKTTCEAWVLCMGRDEAKNPGKLLKAMLNAAFWRNGVHLAQTESRVSEGECVDPHTADPEAFECECMQELEATCGGKDDVEKCLRSFMCENPNVCCAWKQDNCPNADCQTQLLSLMDERGTDEGTVAISNSLDSATSGKCSQ